MAFDLVVDLLARGRAELGVELLDAGAVDEGGAARALEAAVRVRRAGGTGGGGEGKVRVAPGRAGGGGGVGRDVLGECTVGVAAWRSGIRARGWGPRWGGGLSGEISPAASFLKLSISERIPSCSRISSMPLSVRMSIAMRRTLPMS